MGGRINSIQTHDHSSRAVQSLHWRTVRQTVVHVCPTFSDISITMVDDYDEPTLEGEAQRVKS